METVFTSGTYRIVKDDEGWFNVYNASGYLNSFLTLDLAIGLVDRMQS